MHSRISRMRRLQSLDGTDRLLEDSRAHLRSEGIRRRQINTSPQNALKPRLHIQELEHTHRIGELDQHVHVAVITRLVSGSRAEDRNGLYAHVLDLLPMLGQYAEYFVFGHRLSPCSCVN